MLPHNASLWWKGHLKVTHRELAGGVGRGDMHWRGPVAWMDSHNTGTLENYITHTHTHTHTHTKKTHTHTHTLDVLHTHTHLHTHPQKHNPVTLQMFKTSIKQRNQWNLSFVHYAVSAKLHSDPSTFQWDGTHMQWHTAVTLESSLQMESSKATGAVVLWTLNTGLKHPDTSVTTVWHITQHAVTYIYIYISRSSSHSRKDRS